MSASAPEKQTEASNMSPNQSNDSEVPKIVANRWDKRKNKRLSEAYHAIRLWQVRLGITKHHWHKILDIILYAIRIIMMLIVAVLLVYIHWLECREFGSH
jgi:hypothetical protein